jgi:hypothetical protein
MAVTGAGFVKNAGALTGAIGSASSAIGTFRNISGAISGASGFGATFRAMNLPAAGEAIGDITSAFAAFGGGGEGADEWRVRLSLPLWPSFRNSPVLKPLKDAGGLIFPYTPDVQMSSTAKYGNINTMHTNFTFHAYQHSEPGSIVITAPFNVEDPIQGLYWIAAVHYLRSLTKMFSGFDPKAGNPPPIVKLNGYGNYVLQNIPVAVTSFQTTLPKDCDYISVDAVGSMAGVIEGVTDSIGSIADAIGGAFPGVPGIVSGSGSISEIAGGIGQIASLAGSLGLAGSTSAGIVRVPTKSTLQVTLMTMYARNTVQKFSLDRFVGGGYLNSSTGFI